jgi:hypothetical protein
MNRVAVLRSLLLLERHRTRTVIKKRGHAPVIYDACYCVGCGWGQKMGPAHVGRCHVDEALTAIGCPTPQSRDASRAMLGITEEQEWASGRIPESDEFINT